MPHCQHCSSDNHSHSHSHSGENAANESRAEILLLAISAAVFAAALFPFPEPVKIVLFAACALLAAYDIFIDGLKSIFKLRLEENALLLIAVCAAFALGEYFEASVVALLFKAGELLEDYAVSKSRRDTDKLSQIRPDYANLIDPVDEKVVRIKAQQVSPGDKILIRPGDSVPLDCKVLSGCSAIDTSAITGENIPVSVSRDDELLSGSVNIDGALTCEVTKSFENSAASRIVDMVFESSENKGRAEKFITRFSKIYTPAVVAAAAVIALIPPLFGIGGFKAWVMRALIFLVASCPCALIISVPLSFFSTVGALSKSGILVKGSSHIETLSKLSAVAFDKTGTLTTGALKLDKITLCGDLTEAEAIRLAASAEQFSSHPAALAILKRCPEKDLIKPESISETAGIGVRAKIDGRNIACGGQNMLGEYKYNGDKTLPPADIYLFADGAPQALFTQREAIPEHNLDFVKKLKKTGVKSAVMLTGAGEASAAAAAKACGIENYRFSLLPEDKVNEIKKLKASSGVCAFVGDGINDAPCLAEADVGISMGLGTEIANASSDVILASDRLSDVVTAICISKRGMRIMKSNVIFALAVKAAVLTLGAFGLAQMWMAVFADIGVTLITVLNSMRIMASKSKANGGA